MITNILNNVHSGFKTAASYVASGVARVTSLATTTIQKTAEVITAFKAYRAQEDTARKFIKKSLENVSLKTELITPLSESKKCLVKEFFEIFKKQSGFFLTDRAARFVLKPCSEQRADLIISKVLPVITVENARKLTKCILDTVIEMNLLDPLAAPPKEEIGNELKIVKDKVHTNVCKILKVYKIRTKSVVEYLYALIVDLVIKIFKIESHALNSIHIMATENRNFESRDVFFTFQFFEKVTTKFLENSKEFSDKEVDEQWEKFIKDSSPHISQRADKLIQAHHSQASLVFEVFKVLLGDIPDTLVKVRPSILLNECVAELHKAAKR